FTKSGATTTLTSALVTGNTAGTSGGGLFNRGTTTLNYYSVVSYNSATNGYGGGIGTYRGTTTLSQCIVSGNTAGSGGGGLWTAGTSTATSSTTTLTGCTVIGNSAGPKGGGELLTTNGGTVVLTA